MLSLTIPEVAVAVKLDVLLLEVVGEVEAAHSAVLSFHCKG
jgi:hypothetical protein